jgi:hypothetical protein
MRLPLGGEAVCTTSVDLKIQGLPLLLAARAATHGRLRSGALLGTPASTWDVHFPGRRRLFGRALPGRKRSRIEMPC